MNYLVYLLWVAVKFFVTQNHDFPYVRLRQHYRWASGEVVVIVVAAVHRCLAATTTVKRKLFILPLTESLVLPIISAISKEVSQIGYLPQEKACNQTVYPQDE